MNKIILALALSLILTASCKNTQKQKKPNIIVMLVDDAGYADFGFAGSKDLKTPNIDRLANNGMIFTDAHVSASVCGPSRAGIMTGRYQQRFGFECNPDDSYTGVDLSETTIADAMKKAGYNTAAFGKWHLGDDPDYRPIARGFDYFWGFLAGGRSYFPNKKQDKPGSVHSIRKNDEFTTFEGYLTDELGTKAADWIGENRDKPFFIYWAPNAVHTPMEAKESDLDLFKDHPRQTLAAMTWSLDKAVGNMVQKLEEEEILDNTIIFFLSDNGGAHNNQSSNYPLKGFKGNKYEGGHRVPFFVHYPEIINKGEKFKGLTSSLDIFATAVDVAGVKEELEKEIDGVSLLPYINKEKQDNPHQKLFWRKDEMAAVRAGDLKLIRVDRLGTRMYNLKENLQETDDIAKKDTTLHNELSLHLENWESELIMPLWTEGALWDTITWMIHEDLFLNREVRVKNPVQLKLWKKENK
jgi:arylsulfatase A-like enzyme